MIQALKKLLCVAALGLGLALASSQAGAQQPVRLLVGFPPGGTTDVLARLVAQHLTEVTGRSVIVENRPGASGNIAAGMVAKADGDGNTLLFVPSSHATNASLYSNLPFDTLKSFRAVGMVAATPYVLVVNPKEIKARTVPELVAYLKKYPGKVEFASAGPGTGQHLAGELFKMQAKVDIMHVPYKGSSAAWPDLIAGRVPMMFDNIAVIMPLIKKGTLRPLAITSLSPSKFLPDVPTVAASGFPGFEVLGWFALLAPASTPDGVIREYSAALGKIESDPKFVATLGRIGAEPFVRTPQQSDAFIGQEVAKWQGVIRKAHISLN
ncbi:tripartite tricarboxylate transporter substrate binding protein [Candidimonas humi]|uniref:Tripartite tricarboxylate transporter substrate binding protein n=1 Tax=Candidimonas humi TaxID=683355 RepID=A0ABV8P0P1_9BURK|nr:tripartite tricarboxylate transporter substrate binding protein [Candidimonas humi]MBV6306909.1 tripartite tricarboxylate transporter substrate binding protein [Candidimonas humi]